MISGPFCPQIRTGSHDGGPLGAHARAPAERLRGGWFSVGWDLGEVCEDGARTHTSGGGGKVVEVELIYLW